MEVVEAAIDAGCRGLLIDTWSKEGPTLLDWLTADQLRQVRTLTRDAGLLLALAGSISSQHLSLVVAIQPDIIAVRGAVCDGDRTASVSEARVSLLRRTIAEAHAEFSLAAAQGTVKTSEQKTLL